MNDTTTLTASARETLSGLKASYPHTPFLALGQTALWDEPTKAAVRRALDAVWPDARIIAAAHDTDYFAKLPGHPSSAGRAKYAMVLHDDVRTRGLWSAAGEMSCLFGSEDVPSRDLLEHRAGVSLHRAFAGQKDADFALSELTAAWGWTGLIYTRWDRQIARDVALSDILPTLLEQIDWAIEASVNCLAGEEAQERARRVGVTLRGWITGYDRQRPHASLTDLYRDLAPRLYELLLGAPPANLSTSSTSQILRFNRETAVLPRFAFVDLFLNPITRRAALDAYNLSVQGTDTYTLDQFGTGALPFDLVVPGKGRGTLCIPQRGTILVNTPQPITLCDEGCDFASVDKLADLVERELGPDCVLVGKAISLLPMLAAEYLLVFHEGASAYSEQTRALLTHLTQRGIPLPTLHPIVRVKYATWDALSAARTAFQAPAHLAQGFRRAELTADEFANCWHFAAGREEERLRELSGLRSPRELLNYLVRTKGEEWAAKAKEYQTATVRLLTLWEQAQGKQGRVYTNYDRVRQLKQEADQLERAKGDDFRSRIQPLREQLAQLDPGSDQAAELIARIDHLQEERARSFDTEIASRRSEVRFALETIRNLKTERLALERGPEALEARSILRRIEAEAELVKAHLARNALLTALSLPHTNYRPSAWWFPLVDPSGSWFGRVVETAEYHLEPLVGT